jgi:L-aspartate oxidase
MDTTIKLIETDVLIIGTGLAGLLLALKLTECEDVSVVLASKAGLTDSNTTFAQGGLAAVTEPLTFDSPELHLNDTLKSGAGLTDRRAAESIIYGGSRLVDELSKYGMVFDCDGNGAYELALEGGHSKKRVLHSKDATGRAITAALADRIRIVAQSNKRITILENAYATELLTESEHCIGARIEASGSLYAIVAPHTVLATGGVGQVFTRTTNPIVATGDGIALAYRAGARLTDMEFVQFHPTALCKEGAPAFLISEAVRGAGATLLDHNGKRFVKRFHHDGELATRDVVARAIHSVMQEHNLPHVNLDMRPIGASEIARKFPNIQKTCVRFGIDITSETIPISPAAHYFMGGVSADVNGATSLPGLYAIGECACTGLHGANRLASNSLLEAGVMALRLADDLIAKYTRSDLLPTSLAKLIREDIPTPYIVPKDLSRFRAQMYRFAGLVRSESGLKGILREPQVKAIGNLTRDRATARNIMTVGMLIAEAALLRRESRGAHYRVDYPTTGSEEFENRIWLSKTGCGWAIPTIDRGLSINEQRSLLAE